MWDALAPFVGLFLGTFVHEGVTIAAGAMLVVEEGFSPAGVAACLFAGMFAGDLAIYGLGRLARSNEWARRRIGRASAERTHEWLQRHMLAVIAVSRIVPGVLFPSYAAFGLFGVPFGRFALATGLSIAIFMPALLWAVAAFGAATIPSLGSWTWIVSAGVILGLYGVGAWFGRRNGFTAPRAPGRLRG